MLVRILKDIFNNETHCDELNNIFRNFRIGKHILILDDSDTIEGMIASIWYKEINSRDRKVIDQYIRASTRKAANRLLITISESNPSINFSPKEADKYLDQPLVVLVENSEYDPPFLNAIIRHFDYDGLLKQAKQEQWLKFGMGGGSSINSVIKGELEYSFTHSCFTKHRSCYLRYFVIMDSDKKYSDMAIHAGKTQILNENNVRYHILYKREKENYMPFTIIRNLNDDYLGLYVRLPKPEQKDFFDIGDGFKEARNSLQSEVKKLYPEDDVPVKNYEILRRGMTMASYAKGQKFKAEFSKLFDDKLVTKASMLEVINHQPNVDGLNEYEKIVDGIKRLL